MMAASRTRPGNPDRGWNDPPMFNFAPGTQQQGAPRRSLNKRVAFPLSAPAQPGHAVLSPSPGPPVLNPVLSADVRGPPLPPPNPVVPIGLRDTPLGNQGPPISPVQLLPPAADTSMPQTVPLLVPLLVPANPQTVSDGEPGPSGIQEERMEELMSRLSLDNDSQLLQHNMDTFGAVLNKYRNILTMKACDEIKKKLEMFEDRWSKGPLSELAKLRITQLALALLNEETDKANHLHLALMVDHIAEVSQWMMGVKRLLQQQQLSNKEKELISQNREENNCDNVTGMPSEISSSEGAVSLTESVQPTEQREVTEAGSQAEKADSMHKVDSRDDSCVDTVNDDQTNQCSGTSKAIGS